MSIGRNIKTLRLQHGLSQRELAEIAGVTDKAVSTWELDKKDPRMGAIQRMADYFGIKKSDIIEPVHEVVTADTLRVVRSKNFLSEDELKLVNNYRAMDAGKQQAVQSFVEFLGSRPSTSTSNVGIVQSNVGSNNLLRIGDNNSVTGW